MRLLVISHTEHYLDNRGRIVGLSPTVRELNHLLGLFDQITHVAPLYRDVQRKNAIPYKRGIVYVPLEPTGGKTLSDKTKIILKIPSTIKIVAGQLFKTDYFQFRAPTSMGVYLIPFLSIFRKKGWFKYAGNWNEEKPPLSYRIQRFYLDYIFNKKPVTINGRWENQKKHQFTFENPCLTNQEIKEGEKALSHKRFDGKLNLLYVGRIEFEKGIHLFLESLNYLNDQLKSRIGNIYIIGSGKDFDHIKSKYKKSLFEIRFENEKPRDELNQYYKNSHFLFLPSTTEGFPKVVAEASNFGCIPCISNISSIGQYINEKNGLLFNDLTAKGIAHDFSKLANNPKKLNFISKQAHKLSYLFTYDHYNAQLAKYILREKG